MRVTDVADVPRATLEDREAKLAALVREKLSQEELDVLAGIDAESQKGQPGATKTTLKERTGWQSKRLQEVLDRLLEKGDLEEYLWKKSTGKKAQREFTAYRRPRKCEQTELEFTDHPERADLPDDFPALPDDPRLREGTSGDHPGELSPCKGDTPGFPDDPEPTKKRTSRRQAKSKNLKQANVPG